MIGCRSCGHDIEALLSVAELMFGACPQCGLAQLTEDVFPIDLARHNEPEAHLDEVAEVLRNAGVSSVSVLSYKDESLAERLARAKGRDLLIARHYLEHLNRPVDLLRDLQAQGYRYYLFEVPDCSKIFERHLHPFLWGQHKTYFTQATFANFLECNGMGIVWQKRFDYPIEPVLVVLCRSGVGRGAGYSVGAVSRAREFAMSYVDARSTWQHRLHDLPEKPSLLGAHHHAANFVRYYGLEDLFAVACDDDPEKVGHPLAGTKLPVVPVAALRSHEYCVTTIQSRKPLIGYGGTVIEAFA